MSDTLPSMIDVTIPTEKCGKCGKDYPIGEWPYCPHGIPGGMLGEFHPYIDHNLGHDPVEIRSLADRNRLMRENKLEHRSPKVGRKGCEV